MDRLTQGETVVVNSLDEVKKMVDRRMFGVIQDKSSGALMIPIFLDFVDKELIGVLMILDIEGKIISDEEKILVYETITNQIAPSCYHLQQIEEVKERYIINIKNKFLKDLKVEMEEASEFSLDLYIFHVHDDSKLKFKKSISMLILSDSFEKSYQVDDQNLIIISNDINDQTIIKEQLIVNDILYTYKYKEDYNTTNELIELML